MALVRKRLSICVASLAAVAVIGIGASWRPDKTVEELRGRWAASPSQFVSVGDLQVHLRDEGPRSDSVPIVLLHGTSASLHTWEGWAGALRGQRRVIRMDLPGFGLTGPNATDDYSVDSYVRMVVELLDRLGVRRFVIAGNSLGGQVAWSLAFAHPQRVERMILVDASGYDPTSGTQEQVLPLGFHLARTPVVKRVAEYALPRFVVERSVRSAYGDPDKVTAQLVDLYEDMALRAGNRRALVRRIEQGYVGDPLHIQKIAVPTLIIWGGKDRIVPLEFGKRFERNIKNSRLVVFEDLGHTPQEEDPARTVAVVRRFLDLGERAALN
ncbi:alpha/beta fold hydrolase [Caenimonas sp. SL110]|uniref:alpha/beta fold hydrolase n=1 Tax=Caenimonas sp. SL110 TaxID=1450524 RepID=UPI00065372AE|nr:alpha/beta hydrolase [Caenimonas sp. SL110]